MANAGFPAACRTLGVQQASSLTNLLLLPPSTHTQPVQTSPNADGDRAAAADDYLGSVLFHGDAHEQERCTAMATNRTVSVGFSTG